MLTRTLFALPIIAALVSPSLAASDADCMTMWKNADVQTGGKLNPTYAEAFTKSGRAIAANGMVDEVSFMTACKADAFATTTAGMGAKVGTTTAVVTGATGAVTGASTGGMTGTMAEAGAPFPGANSFTETQAMDRIQKAGFTTVAGLKKDADGIWRGTAMKGDKSMSVALDFKGNVVGQ